eukprot:4335995-Heterocapsa_arctica.AAC.1
MPDQGICVTVVELDPELVDVELVQLGVHDLFLLLGGLALEVEVALLLGQVVDARGRPMDREHQVHGRP